MTIEEIRDAIKHDPLNAHKTINGIQPLFTASETARVVIIGQAPGRVAEATQKPWNDISGRRLREWLGVTDDVFYGPQLSLMPMDFYYPGKAAHGDLPPRKDFAPTWHSKLLACMPDVQLIVLIGSYAQNYYLEKKKKNLAQTVQNYQEYLPLYFPIVHPSPLNLRWLAKNPWFSKVVLPELKIQVKKSLGK